MGVEPFVTSTSLSFSDWLGAVGIRLGIGRGKYMVSPGLYKLGQPEGDSPILVTANYKLTFDMLRRQLLGLNLWLLVLDTKGVNVWCAAGKGTFGTKELVQRIEEVGLRDVISHRTLILPQLGAPGVAAHDVTRETGFKIVYGPVRARNIPEFLANNMTADQGMRRVRFDLADRLVVSPLELVLSFKLLVPVFAVFMIWNLLTGRGTGSVAAALLNTAPYTLAWFTAGLAVPMLLPWLPFRSFALKGAMVGLLPAVVVVLWPEAFGFSTGIITAIVNSLALVGLSAFLGLNFTGSSTYTSFSGVKLETAWTVSVLAVAATMSVLMLVGGYIFARGLF